MDKARRSQNIQYLRAQEEICPTTGRTHLQGFVQFKDKITMYGAKTELEMHSEYFVASDNPQAARDYCCKEKTFAPGGYEIEIGMLSRGGRQKGDTLMDIVEMIQHCPSYEHAMVMALGNEVSKQKFQHAWEYLQAKKEVEKKKILAERAQSRKAMFYDWQNELYDHLRGPPNDREVLVVKDVIGGCGKSEFVKTYCNLHQNEAATVAQGKTANMVNEVFKLPFDPKVIFLDLTRFQTEDCNLSAVEMFKNALINNHKYETGTKTFLESPHFVIFTNNELKYDSMSVDRWNIWTLEKTPFGIRHVYSRLNK